MILPMAVRYRRSGIAALATGVAVTAGLYPTLTTAESKLPPGLLTPDRPPPTGAETDSSYRPLGVELTPTITARPSLEVKALYDDNIFRVTKGARGDTYATVVAEISIDSDPANDPIGAYIRTKTARFQKYSAEGYDEYTFGVHGRVDLGEHFKLSAMGGSERLVEERGSAESIREGTGAIAYNRHRLTAEALMSGLALSGYQSISYDNYSYGQSGGVDNRDRNRTELAARTRIGYELSDATIAFVEAEINQHRYQRLSYDGFNRNSRGFRALAGLHYEISDLTFLDLSGGWLQQTYDDRRFQTAKGPAVSIKLGWRPTDLILVSLAADRRVDESDGIGLSGILTSAINLRVSYDPMDNLSFGINGSYVRSDYQGTVGGLNAPRDKAVQYGFDVRYLFTPHLYFYGGWTGIRRISDRPGLEYNAGRFMMGVSTQW